MSVSCSYSRRRKRLTVGYSKNATPDTMIASKRNFSTPLAVRSKMLLLFGSYRQ
jgi:hypothetical protein